MERVKRWADFVSIARERTVELGVSFQSVDQLAGWADNYTSKILSGERQFGEMSFDAMFGVLALDFIPVSSPEKLARIRNKLQTRKTSSRMSTVASSKPVKLAFSHKFYKQIGKLGGLKSGEKRRLQAERRKRYRLNALKGLKR